MTSAALELPELLGYLTPEEQQELDALLDNAPLSFRDFVTRVNPRFVWYDHCVRLAAVLQRVADRELRRVLIAMPPRHGKSELVTRLFPAYCLYRRPDQWVAISSYAADLAHALSRNARSYYLAARGQMADDAAAMKMWETGQGGGLWACGVGGPATGRGFHVGIIDDPVKNAEEAASETIGKRNRDWYASTWYTREEPDGAMIIVQTRWPGPGDLIAHVLALEETDAEDEEPEHWHVVLMEAEKESEPPELPATCMLEPDPRPVGAPLCPERYPQARLKKIATKIGSFFYSALFQQRPRPRTGRMFPKELAQILDAPSAGLRWIRYWDKAGTEGGGAATASVKMAIAPNGLVWIGDSVNAHLGDIARNLRIRQTAELDGPAVSIWIEQEPGSGGKESGQISIRQLAGYDVHVEAPTGDKVTRARHLAAQWQAGNVRLVAGAWNRGYLDRMDASPDAKEKDDMDASSGAFNKLALTPTMGAPRLIPL